MGKATVSLKFLLTLWYAVLLLASIAVLAIYSIFLAFQSVKNDNIPTKSKAIEGISGAAVLYCIVSIILTCCLGSFKFFAILGSFFNLAFTGGFIAIAVLSGQDYNTGNCKADTVNTPLGSGNPNTRVQSSDPNEGDYALNYGTACSMNKVVFIVSIIAAGMFLIAVLVQMLLSRAHSKDKRHEFNYGSSNSKRGIFSRFGRNKHASTAPPVIAPAATAPVAENRFSHATDNTGAKYSPSGYHTGPVGFDNSRSHGGV